MAWLCDQRGRKGTVVLSTWNVCSYLCCYSLCISSVLVPHLRITGAPQNGSFKNCSKMEECLFLDKIILCDTFCVASVLPWNISTVSSRLFFKRKRQYWQASKYHSGFKIGCYLKPVEGKGYRISFPSGLLFCMSLHFEMCCSWSKVSVVKLCTCWEGI